MIPFDCALIATFFFPFFVAINGVPGRIKALGLVATFFSCGGTHVSRNLNTWKTVPDKLTEGL
jgi:hypothetical protein